METLLRDARFFGALGESSLQESGLRALTDMRGAIAGHDIWLQKIV